MIVLALTLPGCQQGKQTYQPFIPHSAPAERPIEKVRPIVHEAAARVDEILEETPVPAVADVMSDNLLSGFEKSDTMLSQIELRMTFSFCISSGES